MFHSRRDMLWPFLSPCTCRSPGVTQYSAPAALIHDAAAAVLYYKGWGGAGRECDGLLAQSATYLKVISVFRRELALGLRQKEQGKALRKYLFFCPRKKSIFLALTQWFDEGQ